MQGPPAGAAPLCCLAPPASPAASRGAVWRKRPHAAPLRAGEGGAVEGPRSGEGGLRRRLFKEKVQDRLNLDEICTSALDGGRRG